MAYATAFLVWVVACLSALAEDHRLAREGPAKNGSG